MQLYIGENIKRLRNQRGITQETLADRMHISAAAVSKWERNESLPDISMVLPLASYFGVSTDEILGLDAAKMQEKIQNILSEKKRLSALGKAREAFELMVRAYDEFPNDWHIIEEYMWQLNYDPNCTGPYGNEVHKQELYALCDRVLDECTVDKVRYSALSIMSGLYVIDGQTEKAIQTVKRFPDMYHTEAAELENCFERGTKEWWVQVRENIFEYTEALQVKIRNTALFAEDPTEQIRILKKAVALMELVFDDGDYGFGYYHLAELYIWIANRYVSINDLDAAFENYEKGLACARAYDTLPKTSVHTSFLVRGRVQDMTSICSDTESNMVALQVQYILEIPVYAQVKDMPQMKKLLKVYEPFMGNKKSYS